MIQINGIITLPEGTLDQAREAIIAVATKSQAEDGCINYTFAEDLTAPGSLILYERWRDQAALEAHMKSAHLAEFQAEISQYGEPKRDIRMYVTDDGQAL